MVKSDAFALWYIMIADFIYSSTTHTEAGETVGRSVGRLCV